MSETKPKIYGTCKAGCLWETVHKDDFNRCATWVKQYADEDGVYTLLPIQTYKINSTSYSTTASATADAYFCSVWLKYWDNDKSQYVQYNFDIKEFDEYRDYFYFEILELKATFASLTIVYEINGNRYKEILQVRADLSLAKLKVADATSVYLFNADASISADAGGSGGSGVTSVNGQTGDVTITVPTKTSELTNDSDFVTSDYHDSTKQDALKSGTNIKTINGSSILGSGNLEISGGGGGETYKVVDIGSQTELTDDQYNTLISSPYNKIFYSTKFYDLVQETSSQLIYGVNYLNTGFRITINKSTKSISTSTTNCLTSISSYVKNDLTYSTSSTTYALSAYQGKVLNDRLTAVENASGGSGRTYQHNTKITTQLYTTTDWGDPADSTFEITFYSSHGQFSTIDEFWAYFATNSRWLSNCGGVAYGNIGGETTFTRMEVATDSSGNPCIALKNHNGYGEWIAVYYMKQPDSDSTDSIVDDCIEM